MVEKNCVRRVGTGSVRLMPESSYPTGFRGEKERQTYYYRETSHPRMHMHLQVPDDTWAGPLNPRAGLRNYWAGPYSARIPWASLSCEGPRPGRAETLK